LAGKACFDIFDLGENSQSRTVELLDIIKTLKEYDLKSKGVDNISASDGELLKELTYKILH